MRLSDSIPRITGLGLIWGKVTMITGDTFTMSYLGGEVRNISHFDHYTPQVDDIVIVLTWPQGGMIAIGSNNGTGAPGPVPSLPPVTITVTAEGAFTYYQNAGGAPTWVGGSLIQGPETAGCWFYDLSLFSALLGSQLAQADIEINLLSGGPPQFLLHRNPGAGGVLDLASPYRYLPEDVPPPGVNTWVPLPIGWAEQLVNGQANGVGIGLSQHTGVYAGTGRLRFTTI